MTTNSKFKIENSRPRPAAFLWDESFLWGVMAQKALRASGLPFDLLRSKDVRSGRLKAYSLLFVPGGWASNKMKALGDDGVDEIKRFVREGGSYLGFCGGAGLATLDGIGLVNIKRRPTKERVPSFSGPIRLNVRSHPLWQGLPECSPGTRTRQEAQGSSNFEYSGPGNRDSGLIFHAWWPSQFIIDQSVTALATYGAAMKSSFSSDVNVGDTETGGGWQELERAYGINLDPKRLLGEPAVIEGRFGAGSVILSLVHFDTPGDANGARTLGNLWRYLIPNYDGPRIPGPETRGKIPDEVHGTPQSPIAAPLEAAVGSLIDLGLRNFLWFWRSPMLLQWRRGVRGLEYCTLHILIGEIAALLKRSDAERAAEFAPALEGVGRLLLPFVEKAKRLLVLERFAIQNSNISYERCDDPKVQALREELFSRSKSHGGLFKELVDEIDGVLYELLTEKVASAGRDPFSGERG